jgi:AAA15 family ATPase/GTPase
MAKLKGIFLQNFQSIKSPTYIELAPITMLYGPNSSGKSAIFDAIKWFAKNIEESNKPFKERRDSQNFLYREREVLKNSFIHDLRVGSLDNEQMKVGVSINFSKDEKLESSIFTEILSTDGEYTVYHMLKFLQDKNIQIEISGDWDTFKLAVDSTPILIAGNELIEFDTNFLSVDDENNAAECNYNLRINYKHKIFEYLWSLHMLDDLAKEQEGTIVGMVLQKHSEWLEIRGVGVNTSYWDVSYPLNWQDFVDLKNIKFSEWIAGEKNDELIKIAKAEFESEKSQDERRSAHHRIIKSISDLNLFLNALLQMVKQGMNYSEVDGARAILSDHECYFNELKVDANNTLFEYSKYLTGESIYPLEPEEDFPNDCLVKLLEGMSPYKFKAIKIVKNIVDVDGSVIEVGPIWQPVIPIYIYDKIIEKSFYFFIEDTQGRSFSFSEVGSGLSYVAPVLTSLFLKPLSLIQQPELHLHPLAQCGLGDVLISAANNKNYSLVETHSEHLLLRILRRVRESTAKKCPKKLTIDCNDVRVYYFNPSDDGFTEVKKLRIDRFGEFQDRWPKGFFTERDAELFDE